MKTFIISLDDIHGNCVSHQEYFACENIEQAKKKAQELQLKLQPNDMGYSIKEV
jgi:hypothetical protein